MYEPGLRRVRKRYMSLPDRVPVDTITFGENGLQPSSTWVSCEYHFTVSLDGEPLLSLMSVGTGLEEIITGHLLSEGIVASAGDIVSVSVDERRFTIDVRATAVNGVLRHLRQAPGGETGRAAIRRAYSGPAIGARAVIPLMDNFLRSSEHHALTRGVHSAALATPEGEQLVFYDEIGRHNAVDKVIGRAALHGINPADKVLLSTGRVPEEIVGKLVRSGIPALITKAAPTDRGVELARRHGLLLIGRVTERDFVIFSGETAVRA